MANKQLTGYIQKKLGKGVSEEQIRQALTKSGWATADVDEAFKTVKVVPKDVKKVVLEESKPKKLEPEQVIKEIIGEEVKEEKVTEEPVKTEESWFNRKKRLIFIVIGLLLIIFYYIFEYIQS